MKAKKRAVISLGSNIADRLGYLQSALELISDKVGKILVTSSVYETVAWGFCGDSFLNVCLQVQTKLAPNSLLEMLLQIENSLGRVREGGNRYTSRSIDLDIIFYDDVSIEKDYLVIPHPQVQYRRFVLEPLAEIIPNYIHPQFSVTIKELLHRCPDKSKTTKLGASWMLFRK